MPNKIAKMLIEKDYLDFEIYKELPIALKYGSEGSIMPLIGSINNRLDDIKDTIRLIGDESQRSALVVKEIRKAQAHLRNVSEISAEKLVIRLNGIFKNHIDDFRDHIVDKQTEINDTVIESLIRYLNEKASSNKWGESCSNFKIRDGYVKVTEKLLYWKGCKVGNDLLDVNIMGLTRKHQLNAITLFNGIANATSNESLIRDVSSCLDDKLVMALQKHSGLTLKSILDKDSCSFLISQEDPLNKDERLRNYETDKFDILFSDLIYISEYVHLNNFIGENSKQKIKDKINVVTECLMLLDKQSMSLQSAKEEAELIFHENDLNLPSEAIIIDCNYPDWYAEYFDYDKDHVGFMKMSELYNSYEKVAAQYDRNLDFITKDITDLKQVIDCEAKNIYAGLPNNDNNLSFN